MARYRKKSKKKQKRDNIIATGFLMYVLTIYAESKIWPDAKSPVFLYFPLLVIIALCVLIAYLNKYINKKRYLNSGLSQIDVMTGEEFEKFLKAHFEKLGYKVHLTPASNDYGVDLILEKGLDRIAVQAKRYRNSVSNSAIQEVAAGINHYNCTSGMVITNSYFTKNAIILAQSNNIILWDRKKLRKEFSIKY